MVISYSTWADYAWKNELSTQKNRVLQHLDEIINEAETDHNPHHMLERALGLAAFCMRRLIECRLVTDRFRDAQLPVHTIPRLERDQRKGREPYRDWTGGGLLETYDLNARISNPQKPSEVANRILHARVIAIVSGSNHLSDGLLIASDRQMDHSVYHFTRLEFDQLVEAFLSDRVVFEKDWVDAETGKTFAIRE